MTTTAKTADPETVTPAVTVTGYDTEVKLFASRYKQGTRTVYGLDLSPAQVISLITRPDPDVKSPGNRAIRMAHAQAFARYFREQKEWVVPGMILRSASTFDFETVYEVEGTEFGVVTIPFPRMKDIHVLDGQHRILGFNLADQGITIDRDKAASALATARKVDPDSPAVAQARQRIAELDSQRKRLSTERVSLEIFVEQDPKAFKQMFFDIADNALGITSSVRARFDTRKVVNRALEIVLEHPLLENRVDEESDRIGRGSPYLMGAKHVAEVVRSVQVGLEGRVSRRQDAEWTETDVAEGAKKFFNVITEAFTPFKAIMLGQLLPEGLRKTNLLGSVLLVRVLAGVYHELKTNHAYTDEMVTEFFAKLDKHMSGPVYPESIWMAQLDDGAFSEGAMAPRGRRQDTKSLRDAITAWALDNPAFLDAEPAPRPEPEPEPVDVSEEEADAILRPETAKARAKKAKKV